MQAISNFLSRGEVEFIELPAASRDGLIQVIHDPVLLESFIRSEALNRAKKQNLVFNFPREQYANLDRGESASIDARYLTLSASAYTDPAVATVTSESLRVTQTTQAKDPNDPKASVIRFILDVGQFVGTWPTAILIGGSTATSTPGTGHIIAAVNSLLDSLGAPVVRSGSTLHLVNWNLKHLDISEA